MLAVKIVETSGKTVGMEQYKKTPEEKQALKDAKKVHKQWLETQPKKK